jgi:ribosomal protein S18 acetylase RimI-like enzyme
MGLGRHLLAQGEAMIAADGRTDFELHARVENLSAIAFYETAGWTVTERLIHTVEHGISYDERVLIKHRA